MSGTAASGAGAAGSSGSCDGSQQAPGGSQPPDSADLEQQQPIEQQQQQQHEEPKAAKRWPQLRLSSVSTRRVQQLDPDSDLLSPMASAEGSLLAPLLAGSTPRRSQPSSTAAGSLLSPRGGAAAALPSPFHTATAVLLEEPLPPPATAGEAGANGSASAAGLPGQPGPGGKHQQQAVEQGGGRYARAAVVGCINAVIALPVMLSFSAIIFRDPFFQPYLGSLVKLVFLASALHQAAFAALSSMPFAVGQVQDVGLIFLSAIASAVVGECSEAGLSAANTLATVLAALTAATGIVGLLIVATGVLKLAGLVQYVPLPVIGGYLSFVGWFCTVAGVSLATGVQLDGSPASWARLLAPDALLKLAPALGLVVCITLVLRRFRSPLALPALLVAAPLLFYAFLLARGLSLDDAREAGWVSKPQPGDSDWQWWRAWSLYRVSGWPPANIKWAAFPGQAAKLLALYFVVAFGSSMDIAAIQADSPQDLDYNSELVTVGLSNVLTACCGVGYTGSYIFSQTLFSMRMGIDSALMGGIIAAAELAVFLVPFNVLTYLPNFFFGGLTAWIGQDILKDWLFIAYQRVSGVEYGLLLATFGAVLGLGLEAGIAAGILASLVHFAYEYSRSSVTAFTVVPSRSGAVRTFDQRTVLDAFSGRCTAVALSGFLFFGSSVSVVQRVMEVATRTLHCQPHLDPSDQAPTSEGADVGAPQQQGQPRQDGQQQGRLQRALPSRATLARTYDNVDAMAAARGGGLLSKVAAALASAPRFLLLDFRRVQGLDATAARSFVTLHRKLQRMGIQLIITHLPASRGNIRRLLAAQGLILRQPTAVGDGDTGSVAWFASMEDGCAFCEERFLSAAVAHGLCPPPGSSMSLPQVLQAHLELPRCILGDCRDFEYEAAAAALLRYTAQQELRAGAVLFDLGSLADDMFIIASGAVSCLFDINRSSVHSRAQLPALPPDAQPAAAERRFRYGPGAVVGDLDFHLQRPRSFTATVEADGGAWRISRAAYEAMAARDPASLLVLQTIVLRSTSLSMAHALEALERSSAAE